MKTLLVALLLTLCAAPASAKPLPGIPTTPGVYALQCVPGLVKIGRARNIAQRMRELQTGCPYELKLLAVLSRDPNDEAAFHRRFARDRRHGEWFILSPAVQAEIRSHGSSK